MYVIIFSLQVIFSRSSLATGDSNESIAFVISGQRAIYSRIAGKTYTYVYSDHSVVYVVEVVSRYLVPSKL